MCQLTLVVTGSELFSKLILSSLVPINADANNGDGTGLFQAPDGFWKTGLSAFLNSDFGGSIDHVVSSNRPIIAHVRAATSGIAVDHLNSHPFVGARFVLAHNGSFPKEGESNTDKFLGAINGSKPSDSMEFLEDMEKLHASSTKTLSALEIVDTVMKTRKGKFAFLIYDKQADTYYVARGKTAPLHISYILKPNGKTIKTKDGKEEADFDIIGYVVNTKKETLIAGLNCAVNSIRVCTGEDIWFSRPVELTENTFYEAKELDLKEIGSVVENAPAHTYSFHGYTHAGNVCGSAGRTTTDIGSKAPEIFLYRRILDFMLNNFLRIQDIDLLLSLFTGKSIADVDAASLEEFCNSAIPMLSAPKKIRKALLKLVGVNHFIMPAQIYTDLKDIEYPWTVNKDRYREILLYAKGKTSAAG